jgi:hypothetical protein
MIINLTQHACSAEQAEAGVVEPADKVKVKELLTFNRIPSPEEMRDRAVMLASMAKTEGADAAMIGGAPYFMATLEVALQVAEIKPLYAFSRRESVDETLPDGSVRKTMVFRHLGWVEVEE